MLTIIIHYYYNLLLTFTTVVLRLQLVSESPGNFVKRVFWAPHPEFLIQLFWGGTENLQF